MTVAMQERPRTERRVRETIPIDTAIADTMAMLGRKGLPVFNKREEVARLLTVNGQGIFEGGTGSGKSTMIPEIALMVVESQAHGQKVVVTQPRRAAAESLYNYLEPTMGECVGLRHKERNTVTNNTQLEFVVERSLLNEIVRGGDPLLNKYAVVIIDEMHEGTADASILLALLKKIQRDRKETTNPLKIVITSATLDKDKIIEYLKDDDTRKPLTLGQMKVEGIMFDVHEHYEKEAVDIRDVEKVAAQRAFEVYRRGDQEPGDMLIFMPGAREIQRTIDALEELKTRYGISDEDIEFVSLTGGDESAESVRKMYEESTKRRIFIATNVAETSITIPSVRVVIDSGLMRINVYDAETGVSGLETQRATKSNSIQRKGRAGRVSEGNVHFLFTKEDFNSRKEFLPPEILRTDLVTQVLLLKELGIKDIPSFDFLDHPGAEKINQAINTLNSLGALNPDGSLSEIGRQMTAINLEPRFARMMVEAEKFGCREAVALVIGMIQNARYDLFSNKEYRITDRAFSRNVVPGSDILTRLNIWNEYVAHNSSKSEREKWEKDTGFKAVGFYRASATKQEILGDRKLRDTPIDLSPENVAKIYKTIAVGFIDNIIVNKNGRYQTLSGTSGVQIDSNSVLYGSSPATFISCSRRRLPRGEIIAGLNFEMSFEDIKKIAPYIESIISAKEQPAITESAAQFTQANTAPQAEPIRAMQYSHQTETAKPEHKESKVKQALNKLRDLIRSWLKKLKIIRS